MAKLKTFRVTHSAAYKGSEIVKGQSYKTVAKRFWGDNLNQQGIPWNILLNV